MLSNKLCFLRYIKRVMYSLPACQWGPDIFFTLFHTIFAVINGVGRFFFSTLHFFYYFCHKSKSMFTFHIGSHKERFLREFLKLKKEHSGLCD